MAIFVQTLIDFDQHHSARTRQLANDFFIGKIIWVSVSKSWVRSTCYSQGEAHTRSEMPVRNQV
jgi:hypothetical protein